MSTPAYLVISWPASTCPEACSVTTPTAVTRNTVKNVMISWLIFWAALLRHPSEQFHCQAADHPRSTSKTTSRWRKIFPADALFWLETWRNAGRQNWGQLGAELHKLMAWSRNKYHYAVRRAKRAADSRCRAAACCRGRRQRTAAGNEENNGEVQKIVSRYLTVLRARQVRKVFWKSLDKSKEIYTTLVILLQQCSI